MKTVNYRADLYQYSKISTYRPTIPVLDHSGPLVLSIKVLSDIHSLALVLRNGEIATLSLDDIAQGDATVP